MTGLPEELGSKYYRKFLSGQGRMFYDRINEQLLKADYSGKTSFSISRPETAASDCFAAYKAIRDDHPEYFYLGFHSEFTHCGHYGTLEYSILYTPQIIARIRCQMRKSICRIIRGAEALPMIDREILVYERIAKKLFYENHNDVRDHNIVGPVLLSSGVCEGHNALLMLCFKKVGIPCIKVYGRTKKHNWHCWTIAWINGTPVHCDVTWDETEEGIVRFNYLNLSDNQISGDHFDFQGAKIPMCTSEALNYYRYHGLYVNSFHDLRRRLRIQTLKGISPILIHFNYRPPCNDYFSEVQRAFCAERIIGNHSLYYHETLNNMAVKKI